MPSDEKQWPRRPPRLGRLFDTVRPFYFITFNTYERQEFLARPEVHEAICIFCSRAQKRGVAVGRYVIMPNHVHLFAAFAIDGIALPNWVQSLRSVMGKQLLRAGVQKSLPTTSSASPAIFGDSTVLASRLQMTTQW